MRSTARTDPLEKPDVGRIAAGVLVVALAFWVANGAFFAAGKS